MLSTGRARRAPPEFRGLRAAGGCPVYGLGRARTLQSALAMVSAQAQADVEGYVETLARHSPFFAAELAAARSSAVP